MFPSSEHWVCSQNVNMPSWSMRIFNRATIARHAAEHVNAAQALWAWYDIARTAAWTSMADVRSNFPAADRVGDRIVFDIKGNSYRLIVAFDFTRHNLFIKFFGTHAEYDKVDAAKVDES